MCVCVCINLLVFVSPYLLFLWEFNNVLQSSFGVGGIDQQIPFLSLNIIGMVEVIRSDLLANTMHQ